MTSIEAATLYVGLFGFLFMALKLNCGRVRAATKVDFGDGGDDAMGRAMRVQANAVEDVPVVLIGLYGLAALDAGTSWIHGLGASFFVFRLLHALGMGGFPGLGIGRLIGTLGTLIVALTTAGACVYFAVT